MRIRASSHHDMRNIQTTTGKFRAAPEIHSVDDDDDDEKEEETKSSFSKIDRTSSSCPGCSPTTKQRSGGGWLFVSRFFSSKKKAAGTSKPATGLPSSITTTTTTKTIASSSILINNIPIPTLLESPTAYLIDETPDTYMDGFPVVAAHGDGATPVLPVFLIDQLDEAVPWRVLEPHEGGGEGIWLDGNNNNGDNSGGGDDGDGDIAYEDSSWLELNTDSSSRMSHWLSKPSESLEIARDLVVRRSKSLRRCWHRNQHHPSDSGYESDDSSSSSSTRPISSGSMAVVLLEAVPEESVGSDQKH